MTAAEPWAITAEIRRSTAANRLKGSEARHVVDTALALIDAGKDRASVEMDLRTHTAAGRLAGVEVRHLVDRLIALRQVEIGA